MAAQLRSPGVVGTLATAAAGAVAGVAGSYLATGATSDFVGVPVNAVVVDVMPPSIVTFSILTLGKLGELIGFALALALVVVLFGGAISVALLLSDRLYESVLSTAFFVWLLATVVTAAPIPSFGAAAASGVVVGIVEYHGRIELIAESRRNALKLFGGVLGFGVASYLLGSRVHPGPGAEQPLASTLDWSDDRAESVRRQLGRRLEAARSKSLDVSGLSGLVSATDSFYEVDIDFIDPKVDADEWSLTVSGEVQEEFSLTYDDITAMPPEHRFVTLRCVSDSLNGELMDTALWTGIPVQRLFDRANPRGEYVVLRAQDDYYQEFPLEAFEGGLLAYGMNGNVLPEDHGFPVRALVPGHWGEVNVKWLTEIEVHDSPVLGYWEKRGWHGTGPVHTVAKLWTVNYLSGGAVEVAGYAYAGIQGIRAVEVSVDGGETWSKTSLSEPLDDADTWRQWSYRWSPSAGRHTVLVRAIDGEGTVQPREKTPPKPSGATGWVSKQIRV